MKSAREAAERIIFYDQACRTSTGFWDAAVLRELAIVSVSSQLAWDECCRPPSINHSLGLLAGMRMEPGDVVSGAIFAARLAKRALFRRLSRVSDLRGLGALGEPFLIYF